MSIPNAFIQDLIARADVVDIVGKHVQLKKGGANFMGLCPFHTEKSPSFTVSPTKQFYHCFGCGKSGNAIGFLMEYLGMSFVEAVEDLAQQMGIPVPQEERSPLEQARAAQIKAQQNSLTVQLEKAATAYKHQLKSSPKTIQYLEKRGLSGKIAARFGLGYAPAGWRFLANVFPDYSATSLVEAGLVIHHAPDESHPAQPEATADEPLAGQGQTGQDKRYDRFRDRVMFPIRSIKGDVIGFGGRVFGDEKPKYLNSPETPVFHKGQELYGLFEAREAIREHGFVLVTEGYMDVVALAQLGFANAVATLGTACTPDHARKLFRFADKVVFAFDGDSAGQRAARKALEATLPFATDTRSAKFLFLPTEHDPDSFIRAHGPEAFSTYIQNAVPLSRFLIDCAGDQADLDTTEGRALLASQAEPLWTALPDGAFKRQLLVEIAQKVGLGVPALSDLWQLKAQAAARYQRGSSHPTPGRETELEAPPDYSFDSRYMEGGSATKAGLTGKGNNTSTWKKGSNGRWSRQTVVTQPPMRRAPISRKDNALRLLLCNTSLWEQLGSSAHDMLCQLKDPHGAIFRWIDTQYHDKGPQPWSALQVAMQEQEWTALAERLMNEAGFLGADEKDLESEWQDTLLRLEEDQLNDQVAAVALQAQHNPALLKTLSDLHRKIAGIKQQLAALPRK